MPARKKTQRSGRNPTSAAAPQRAGSAKTVNMAPLAKSGFPIVGIGASAGGLEALEQFFQNLPLDTGMAFIVLTHQHPGHMSLLPDLLDKQTALTVVQAGSGMKVAPNHVYVCPPGGHLSIQKGILQRTEIADPESPRLPIDYFLRSLATDQKERAICIILSGTGTDGTLGVKAIKAEAGMVMAQQPQSAKFAGMPSSAIATGLVDYVLPPAGMPRQLLTYAKGPYLTVFKPAAERPPIPAEPLQKILGLLRNRTGHDFSAYKASTLNRRIERRMNLHQIPVINDYVRYLQETPHELDILFKEFLISVTNFFRDAEAWESLTRYLETMVRSRPEHYTLRIWVPGCATGEETFSVAIILRECMDRLNRNLSVQIFGTDLDPSAIETARAAEYPSGIAVDISPKRLERYFTQEDGTYRVRKEIRQMVVFAQQSVIKDPPFTRLDLLSCRNLLIYLNTELQKKLIPIFHYSLKPGGLMFLGPSETIGSFTDMFEPLDRHWKIFRRKEALRALHALPSTPVEAATRAEPQVPPALSIRAREGRVATQFERVLLNRFAPASVITNERGDILYIHGRTGMYLEPAAGEPSHNLLNMLREGLQVELPSAMRECIRKGKEVIREDILVKNNGESVHIDLSVSKLTAPEALRGLLLITFRPLSPKPLPARTKSTGKKSGDGQRIQRLERELQRTKESHQITLEELESSNEELKSANEELQSINEELQSTNEELETSKEEMQSLNEELTTLNNELQSKLTELSRTNDDMENLLNSTAIATIFLDDDLNVKRFTQEAYELIRLRDTDIGRPIAELTSNLQYDLSGACSDVLRTLKTKEAEVSTKDGKPFLMRIMPYRTAEGIIDGLVMTFVDLVELKQTRTVSRGDTYFRGLVDVVREPLMVLDGGLRVLYANPAYYKVFHSTSGQTEGRPIYQVGTGYWDTPRVHELLDNVLPRNKKAEDVEIEIRVPQLGRRVFLLTAKRVDHLPGSGKLILMAINDKTVQ